MAKTAAAAKRRTAARKGSHASKHRPALSWLITSGGGRITLAIIVIVGVLLGRAFLSQGGPSAVRDGVLHTVGYGVFPLAGWAALFLASAGFQRGWLSQAWRWWIASALFILALQTLMGGVYGSEGVSADDTLGGVFGAALWGGSFGLGVLRSLAFLCLALVVLRPQGAWRMVHRTLAFLGQLLWSGLLWSIRTVYPRTRRAIAARWGKVEAAVEAEDAAWEEEELWPENEEAATTSSAPLKLRESPLDDDLLPALRNGLHPEKDPKREDGLGPLASAAPRLWLLPPMPLLDHGPRVDITQDETSETADMIEETLRNHGVEVEVNQIKPGPTVTLYGLTPGWIRKIKEIKERDEQGNVIRDEQGRPLFRRKKEQTRVRVDTIVAREKDLALALAAPSLRIQAPVPGESVVGIEVPNRKPVMVSLRSVLESPQVREITRKSGLALGLGQGSGGEPVVTSLRKLPHLLIAGTTGSGKSVCLNTIIVSLITLVPPDKLRLLLIDPKRVELTPYNGLPHLIIPVVVDTEDAVVALKGMLKEMFRRYKLLEAMGVRNIDGYHALPDPPEPLPYLVIVVDELADLMMSDRYNVERTVTRLAQLGRSTGIHLAVATQRPSVDVVTGLIKANFPSRISFAVISQVDSRTILDAAGAEKLLGKGDMLFLSTDTPKPQRVQGAYLSDREIGRVMDFWRNQQGPPLPVINLEPEPEEDPTDHRFREEGEGGSSGGDELRDKAIELAGRYSQISTSLLQRRLRIGYPRAARLMDQLEEDGIIGPGDAGKPREVYLPRHEAPPGPGEGGPGPA
ncbi:MAG: DNA translocase FtsK [Chloroflexi bacterium]|nr:DNA translocase FtsK [Chloroflexota bacterium]